jgi:hypothetical protein
MDHLSFIDDDVLLWIYGIWVDCARFPELKAG